MPMFTEASQELNYHGPIAQGPAYNAERNEPDFLEDVLPAAFRLDNTIGSALSNDAPDIDNFIDPEFDPFALIPEENRPYADRYAFLNTQKQVDQLNRQIERERKDRQMVEDAGALGFGAAMAAGIVDPINLIPVGGAAYKTYRIGGSILSGAMVTGRAALLSTTAQEAMLHKDQIIRTYGESAINVAGATFLGGVLGGSAGFVSDWLGKNLDELAEDILPDLTVQQGGSGGAAAVDDIPIDLVRDIEDDVNKSVLRGDLTEAEAGAEIAKRINDKKLELAGMEMNAGVKVASKIVGQQDPTFRLQNSGSIEARRAQERLSETTVNKGKNAHDIATGENVERSARNHDAKLYKGLKGLDDAFAQYAMGRSKKFGDVVRGTAKANFQRLTGQADRLLTYKEFRIEVGKAMRNGDVHSIPEVAQAAKHLRKEVYEPLRELAAKYIDPEYGEMDVKTAVSYLNRSYNKQALVDNRGEFIDIVSEWLMGKNKTALDRASRFADDVRTAEASIAAKRAELQELEAAVRAGGKSTGDITEMKKAIKEEVAQLEKRRKLNERDLSEKDMTEGDFRALAEEIHGRILSTPDGRLPYDVTLTKDPMKGRSGKRVQGLNANLQGRKFLIEDSKIEKFLESDVEQLSKMYVRNMAPDIELRRLFPDDDMELTQTIKRIEEDWAKKADTDPNWKKKMDADIRDVAALRDKIRGQFGLPDNPLSWGSRTGRLMRQLNYIRLLGGMTLSAIPDIARPVMVHGFSRVYADALKPMITEFSNFAKVTQEIRDMGLAMDMLTNARLQSLADITDDYARYTGLERTVGAMSDTMGMVSLMAPWNTAMKQMAGAVSQARMIRAIRAEAAGNISKKELKYLNAAGIDQTMRKKIAAELSEFGKKTENGLLVSGWVDWTDLDAKRVFQSAVGRDVDRIIITPGMDVPLWAGKSEVGRMIFQFKSFAVASTQRTLISGLQQRDMAALNGMWLAVALGSLTAGVKMWDAGKGDEVKKWTAGKWITEGVDRSGLTGWLFEANNMLEKATRGHIGASALSGEAPMSRYASRNIMGALLGPSAGLVSTAFGVTGSLSEAAFGDEDWRESDTHAIRRMLPYQNLMGFRRMVDKAAEGVNSYLGAK